MDKDKKYFENQIKGLLLILKNDSQVMIARDYIREKLNMILESGINFHPSIKDKLI